MARWVAAITVHANSCGDANLRDSESLPAARDRRSQRQQERRRRPARPVIAPELGGHDFRRTHGMVRRAWQCIVCHCTTNNPVRLSHQHCSGSAVCRWARQSAALADRGRGMGEGHTLLLTGTVVWCFRCGASACVRAQNLLKPCPRKPRGYLVQSRQRLLLGLHPEHRTPLGHEPTPEPGQPGPPGFENAVALARASSTTVAAQPKRARRAGAAPAPEPRVAPAVRLLPALEAMRDRIRQRQPQ